MTYRYKGIGQDETQTAKLVRDEQHNRTLPTWRRSEPSWDTTGVDIALADGDLQVSPTGDLMLVGGTRLVQEALLRRLSTAPFGYLRPVFYKDEVLVLDEDYGNPAYVRLSLPIRETEVSEICHDVATTAAKEHRISNIQVTPKPSLDLTRIEIELQYEIKNEAETYLIAIKGGSL